MSEFTEEVHDRLKKIPPWGYAVIAVGVLGLAYFTKNKGSAGAVTPTIEPVDPSVATYNNDSEWRMQDMYNRLGDQLNEQTGKMQTSIDGLTQESTTLQSGLAVLTQQITDLKKPPAPVSTGTSPAKSSSVTSKAAPTKTSNSAPVSAKQSIINKVDSKYKGNSIVDYLKGAGVGSSFADRKKDAATLGIKNYTGTAAQNLQMLHLLRSDGA